MLVKIDLNPSNLLIVDNSLSSQLMHGVQQSGNSKFDTFFISVARQSVQLEYNPLHFVWKQAVDLLVRFKGQSWHKCICFVRFLFDCIASYCFELLCKRANVLLGLKSGFSGKHFSALSAQLCSSRSACSANVALL